MSATAVFYSPIISQIWILLLDGYQKSIFLVKVLTFDWKNLWLKHTIIHPAANFSISGGENAKDLISISANHHMIPYAGGVIVASNFEVGYDKEIKCKSSHEKCGFAGNCCEGYKCPELKFIKLFKIR